MVTVADGRGRRECARQLIPGSPRLSHSDDTLPQSRRPTRPAGAGALTLPLSVREYPKRKPRAVTARATNEKSRRLAGAAYCALWLILARRKAGAGPTRPTRPGSATRPGRHLAGVDTTPATPPAGSTGAARVPCPNGQLNVWDVSSVLAAAAGCRFGAGRGAGGSPGTRLRDCVGLLR